MNTEEGGIPAGDAACPDRPVLVVRAVAYLGFLLRVLTRSKPPPSRVSRPRPRLFLATLCRA